MPHDMFKTSTQKLLKWNMNEEEKEWAAKAVHTLVKRLEKQNKSDVADLLKSLENRSNQSKCVTIPRSVDGRLQIMHRKSQPHVIYCKIWRWPDLQSQHELKPIETCENNFYAKKPNICINPYHYARIEHIVVPPAMVPPASYYPDQNALMDFQKMLEPVIPQIICCPLDFDSADVAVNTCYNNQPSNIAFRTDYPETSTDDYFDDALDVIGSICKETTAQKHRNALAANFCTPVISDATFDSSNLAMGNNNVYSNFLQSNNASPAQPDTPPESVGYTSENSPNGIDNHNNNTSDTNSSQSNNSPQNTSSNQVTPLPTLNGSPVSYKDPENWTSISYYELNSRVGDTFHCTSKSVIIDGYTDPDCGTDRFCLGHLCSVKHDDKIEQVKRAIGAGIKLFRTPNGDVFIQNRSEKPIFFQSKTANYSFNLFPSTVIKVLPKCSMRIFSTEQFAFILQQALAHGYNSVCDLIKFCIIRLSFAKGWGALYNRQSIDSTPCWIEIKMNGPLQWIDEVLRTMNVPNYNISSWS